MLRARKRCPWKKRWLKILLKRFFSLMPHIMRQKPRPSKQRWLKFLSQIFLSSLISCIMCQKTLPSKQRWLKIFLKRFSFPHFLHCVKVAPLKIKIAGNFPEKNFLPLFRTLYVNSHSSQNKDGWKFLWNFFSIPHFSDYVSEVYLPLFLTCVKRCSPQNRDDWKFSGKDFPFFIPILCVKTQSPQDKEKKFRSFIPYIMCQRRFSTKQKRFWKISFLKIFSLPVFLHYMFQNAPVKTTMTENLGKNIFSSFLTCSRCILSEKLS